MRIAACADAYREHGCTGINIGNDGSVSMTWDAPYVAPAEPERELSAEEQDLADKAAAEAAAAEERRAELWSVA